MLINIQFLRFAAALLVLFHHAAAHLRAAQHPPGILFQTGEIAGFAGVDIFFVISGFIMAWTSFETRGAGDALVFARRRVARIYSGYWPFFLLALAMFWYFNPGRLANVSMAGSFLLWPTELKQLLIPVSWTLIYEMGFYALFTALILVPAGRRDTLLRGLLAGVLAWSLYSQFLRGAYEPGALEEISVYELYWAFPFLLEFLAGAVLAGHLKHRPGGTGHLLLLGGLALLLAGGWINQNLFGGKLFQGYQVLWRIAIFGSAAVAIVAGSVRLEQAGHVLGGRFSLAMGGSSYALYLSHTLLLYTASRFGLNPFLATLAEWAAWSVMVLLCALIVLVSLLHYLYIERPLHRLFRRTLRV